MGCNIIINNGSESEIDFTSKHHRTFWVWTLERDKICLRNPEKLHGLFISVFQKYWYESGRTWQKRNTVVTVNNGVYLLIGLNASKKKAEYKRK